MAREWRRAQSGSVRHPVRVPEIFGLSPLRPALAQSWLALAGDAHSCPTRWGPSSLGIFRPRISLPLWLGRRRADGRVPVYNLFNREPAPRDLGHSVCRTHARDFRGGRLTYDGHVGTDFAVPVGTEVVAAARGVVSEVRSDLQRGGLKVLIDHGGGLATGSHHLARALVRPGDRVARGQTIGLSGMSGLDGILFFPWLAPHVHFNVLLDGDPVDPFAAPGELALWREGNAPRPYDDGPEPELEPTPWSEDGVEAAIAACRDPAQAAELRAIAPLERRAMAVALARVIRFGAFEAWPSLVERASPRRRVLDLPFRREDAEGIVFADEA